MKKLVGKTAIPQTTAQPTTNVQPISSTPTRKPQTSKEVIAANVQLLIEQLEAGHSEGLTSYSPQWVDSTPTRSATSLRSPGSVQTRPASRVCTPGISLAGA